MVIGDRVYHTDIEEFGVVVGLSDLGKYTLRVRFDGKDRDTHCAISELEPQIL